MDRKPLVGLSCSYDYGDVFAQRVDIGLTCPLWNYISESYLRCIERAGGVPLVIPNMLQEDDLYRLMDLCDGFLLTGGNDVDPQFYGEVDHGKCARIVPGRDRQELAMVRYIMSHPGKSVFAICRGLQILNVALGGSLIQDVEEAGFDCHAKNNYALDDVTHSVTVESGSLLSRITGPGRLGVNSFHHQAVRELGRGLTASAHSHDGLVEAVELDDRPFFLAVQWHPEKMAGDDRQQSLFRAFVESMA